MSVAVSTFYQFIPMTPERVDELQRILLKEGSKQEIQGLFILSTEGINATFSGKLTQGLKYKEFLNKQFDCALSFKDSSCDSHPFHELKIKQRHEIVSLNRPDLNPQDKKKHLSPREWHEKLLQNQALVLDARNDYEIKMGSFKNAINPKIKEFNEFSQYIKNNKMNKNKEILIYCTGGIRCEKAALEMKEQGYEQVYQLDGGILNYISQYPEGQWEGECFVFDYRVGLDSQLAPTRTWKLCPHCGDPGKESISCLHCGTSEIVCTSCLQQSTHLKTCSKNCAHHYKMGHQFKAKNNIHKPKAKPL